MIQILVISVLPTGDHTIHTTLHLASYFLLGAFAFANRHIVGVPIIALGGLLNFIAIAANGGVMPADPDAIASLARALPEGEFANSQVLDDAKLQFLGDVFATPASLPLHNVFSIGDGILLVGVFVLVHVACGSRLVPRRFASRRAGGRGLMFRAALSGAPARRFFAAHAQSCLGTGLAYVALPLLAYERFDTPWAIAAVLLPDLLPAIVLGPVLGALVDRIGWRTCAVVADALRCLAFLLVMSADSLPLMIAGAALAGLGTALFTPAALAGLPRLMDGDGTRAAGMGLFGAIDDLGLTAGPALAAVLLAVISPTTLMGLNAVTFAISAVLIATIAARGGSVQPREPQHAVRRRARRRPRARLAPGDPRRCSPPRPASCSASASPTSARSCSRARSCTSAAPASRCWSPPAASARSSARSAPASPPPARGPGAAPTCSASPPWPSS